MCEWFLNLLERGGVSASCLHGKGQWVRNSASMRPKIPRVKNGSFRVHPTSNLC